MSHFTDKKNELADFHQRWEHVCVEFESRNEGHNDMSKKMHKNTQIKLKQAPILYEFLKRLLEFDGRITMKFDMGEELFIRSRCMCEEEDCATVYLQRAKAWEKEIQGSFLINTSKGIVIFHFSENGLLEIESLGYKYYPYKQEIQRVLNDDFSPTKSSEVRALNNYFSTLKDKMMDVVMIDT